MFKIGDKVAYKGGLKKYGVIRSIGQLGGGQRCYYVTWGNENRGTLPTYTMVAEDLEIDTRVRDNRISKLNEIGI